MAKKKLPKGVKIIQRYSVMRKCGHVQHLPESLARYSLRTLIVLTETPCHTCKESDNGH